MGILVWLKAADAAMSRLEADPSRARLLAAVNRTLDSLEADRGDGRLGTRTFVTVEYRYMAFTPVGHDDWYVFWQLSDSLHETEIVNIDGPFPFL